MRVPGVRFVQGRNRYGTSTKYGIAIHNTSNDASDEGEASYAQRRTDGTSSHFYVDGDSVTQSLDTADRAGHAGSDEGNSYAIAFEITGANAWSRATWLSSVAWDKLGAVLAAVSRHHNIPATRASVSAMEANPRVRGAYDHNQMRLAWGGTDHTDPGPNFPWDKLLAVWKQHLNPTPEDDMDADQARMLRNLDRIGSALINGKTEVTEFEWPAGVKKTYPLLFAAQAKAAANGVTAAETAAADALAAVRELAARPAPGTVVISDEQLERVLRKVMGSVDGATPAA